MQYAQEPEIVLPNLQYLCNGLEEDIAARQAAKGGAFSELDLLIQASGKMVLLAKLLPKLREEGHKVGGGCGGGGGSEG